MIEVNVVGFGRRHLFTESRGTAPITAARVLHEMQFNWPNAPTFTQVLLGSLLLDPSDIVADGSVVSVS